MAEFERVQHITDIFDLSNRFRTNLKRFRTRFLFPFIRFTFALKRFRTRFLFPFIRFTFALPINGNAVYDIL